MNFITELPIGVKDSKGELKKVFSLNDLTVEDLKKIQNPSMKSDHPMVWLGKTISRVVHEIDGVNVSGEFRASKNKIPEIVRSMTLIDVSYALMTGHVHNLGSDLPPFKSICPACRNHVEWNVDLSENLLLPDVEVAPDETFEVQLINGYEHKASNAADIGIDGKVWNVYTFRLPTLNDALRNEQHWSGTSDSTFTERIMADCLVEVKTEDGEVMEDKIKQMIHENLLLKLPIRDMKEIGKSYGNIAPSFRFLSDVQCNKCGRGVEVPIDPNFLYTTG